MTTVQDLEEFGLVRMTEGEIDDFLSSQGLGVLGLPTDGPPYLLPMSFGYDGESNLYFTYIVGSSSRKEELTERASQARFLVYNASSAFVWESVLLTGTLSRVTGFEADEYDEAMDSAWRPGLFEEAMEAGDVHVYRFRIEDVSGVKHTGLPPGFERELPDEETA